MADVGVSSDRVAGRATRSGGPGLSRVGRGSTRGLIVKLLLLAAVNGLALLALPKMVDEEKWLFVAFTVVATLAIDYVYLSNRAIPAKYLIPGTLFLVAFQVYPLVCCFVAGVRAPTIAVLGDDPRYHWSHPIHVQRIRNPLI